MKLGYTIIYVPSVPSALDFYQRAFALPTRFCIPSNDYGELDLGPGTTTLAFADENFVQDGLGRDRFRVNRPADDQAAGGEIALVVDESAGESVEGAYARALAAGATSLKAPAKKPWGQTVAYVRDLNGFIVELCSPVAT